MISEYDMREKMAAVLANKLSIVDFARWIMSNSWNMLLDSSSSAVSLASEIHALLAERADYSLSDSAFLLELHNLSHNSLPATNSETKVVSIADAVPHEVWVFKTSSPSVFVPVRIVPAHGNFVPARANYLPAMV